MTVTAADGHASFLVQWPNSAADMWTWEFSGEVNAEGIIEYSNGLKSSHCFDENGDETVTELSDSNSGRIWIGETGELHWIDNESGDPEGSVFDRNY